MHAGCRSQDKSNKQRRSELPNLFKERFSVKVEDGQKPKALKNFLACPSWALPQGGDPEVAFLNGESGHSCLKWRLRVRKLAGG
jgi:hypothetical protein